MINKVESEHFSRLDVGVFSSKKHPQLTMKLRSLLSLAVVLGSFVGLNSASANGHGHDHSELGEQMEVIGKTFRSLRRSVRDASKNAESAEMVGKMLKAAKASIDHKPAWTAEQPKAEQADFVAGYKKEMKVFIQLLTDLKAALEADDNDKANDIIGKLRDQQRDSHKAYKKPDED
ncbi:MAG: hypothetical protein SynsKO_26480 [Synoicihabitans sp.]